MPETMSLPPLYKLADNGAIICWNIRVDCESPSGSGTIITRWGQTDGKVQETRDHVTKGKNVGKKNETTAYEQACAEAQSKWTKQQKAKGYAANREAALTGGRSDLVEGGVDPMLAHKYRDHAKKVKWPAYCQPKLDGIRCIAVIKGGACSLWSRTRKRITGIPHVERALEAMFSNVDIILDGEAYNHSLKTDFERITSLVRQVTPQPGHEIVQYHIYDVVQSAPFSTRTEWLNANIKEGGCVKLVPTVLVGDEDGMLEYFSQCLADGWEGCMVRGLDSTYESKRSYGLQKVKEMQDGEYLVVGVEEGRGKMAGKAVFNCKADNGDMFAVKMKGSLDSLTQYVADPSLVIGKKLTVQYQNLSAYGIPRFPVGLRIRNDE